MLLPLFEFGRFILSQYIATMLWLMLLPCGRCYHHCCSYSCMLMADVIAMWQMEKPPFFFVRLMLLPSGRWNGHCTTFGEMFKGHLKAPSPLYDHYNTTGHNVTLDNFSIVGKEDQNLCRWIKEALYIRVNNPSLNKNIGKYHLPHIWDEVLHNTSELKLK